ncbi:cathepsin K [Trichonephila clavipes]|nr:cathepsin K [Trichonephila clavipes]
MQLILSFCLFAATASYSLPFTSELDEHWGHFKNVYSKTYTSAEETRKRLVWEERVTSIVHHNLRADAGLHSFRRGLNKYSDLTHDEYMQNLNGFKARKSFLERNATTWLPLSNVNIPEQVDWRHDGLVTPVKDQDEVEKLAYQLNEEAERTERPIRRLSKVMYGSTCADMQVDVMGECLSSIKHVVGARRNRRQTAGEIARHTTQVTGRPISRFTVARRLHGGGLFARRPVRCVPLTPAHRRRRFSVVPGTPELERQ